MKKSEDGIVKFFEKKHVYKIGKEILTSGTSFLKPYFQPFDAKKIARKLAKFPQNRKAKRGVRYWLNEWKQAAQHGTDTHLLMENFFVSMADVRHETDIDESYEERTYKKATNGYDWLLNYWKNLDVLMPNGKAEYIVYNKGLGIAGQIDLLVERMDIKTGEMVWDLIDWKTSKKIDGKNYEGLSCFEPLQEFESSTYLKYQLQLSLYAYLLELQGKKIGRLILVHLKENKAQEIDMGYRPDLIERLLDHRGKND